MWIECINHNIRIKSIYKDKTPNINAITVNKIDIKVGEDLFIDLNITLKDLPDCMPKKWKDRNVDTIVFDFSLYDIYIKSVAINNENFRNIHLDIYEIENGIKKIIGKDILGKVIFDVETYSISIMNISGYNSQIDYHGYK